MRATLLLVACTLFALPACQTTTLPKATFAVEAPPDAKDIKDVRCKLEVKLN